MPWAFWTPFPIKTQGNLPPQPHFHPFFHPPLQPSPQLCFPFVLWVQGFLATLCCFPLSLQVRYLDQTSYFLTGLLNHPPLPTFAWRMFLGCLKGMLMWFVLPNPGFALCPNDFTTGQWCILPVICTPLPTPRPPMGICNGTPFPRFFFLWSPPKRRGRVLVRS